MINQTLENLTPDEREKQKTADQRAEDIAYTINHALACTATDFIDPYVGNLTQKWFGKRISIGCGHDHSKDHDHHHEHEHGPDCKNDHQHTPHDSHLGHWWVGEVVGDFGAVPITVGMQRYCPNFMNGLRKLIEPMLGGFFRKGAERSAGYWAQEQGVDVQSQAYKDRVEAIYRHEVDHLPQALIWTVSSIALNLTTQRLMGNKAPLWQLATGKAIGASISASLVVGGRGFAPGTAEKWDKFTSEKLFLPATKAVGKAFGVDEEAVDRMAEKRQQLKNPQWTERLNNSSPELVR